MELSVRRLQRVLVTFVALLVVVARFAHAESLPDRTERVIGLARVWAKAKFFHPYLAYKDIDWDAALVAAIPKAEAATSVVEYRAAIHGMLAVLRDPVTRVLDAPAPTGPKPLTTDWLTTPSAGVVEVKIASFVSGTLDYVAIGNKATRVLGEAAAGKVLIVDLRAPGASAEAFLYTMQRLAPVFPAIDQWPVQRTIEHHGFRTQDHPASDDYFSTFVSHGSLPPRAATSHAVSHVVFIVDLDSYIPAEVLALQAAGRGTVVAYGGLPEDHAVSTVDVELPGKLTARVRLGELLWETPTADVTVARAQDLEARARALAKVVAIAPIRAKPKKVMPPLPLFRTRDDLDYADPLYPSRERRMLAGIRMWAVLDNVYPYRYLIGDWEGVLREMLPQLADAPDRTEYLHALRRMAVRPNDGHIGVSSATPDPAARPRGYTAIDTRIVEGKLAVVRLLDATEARQHGLEVGDVIETINGKPAAAALAEVQREVTGSTEETRVQWAAVKALSGDDGTTVELGVRGADGKLRNVSLVRSVANAAARQAKSTSPHWKTLAGNVGYVDLRELLIPEIDPMLEDLKATRAIVFDMRGYPNGTGRDLAPRLNTRKSTYGALYLAPLATGEGRAVDRRVRFLEAVVALPKNAWVYSGTIVVLIDDRAISQAEHTCLFFAEAAGATFIGSPTAGANGDITIMRLPGGLRMQFTGQEVRHVDGRQLQQVGIQPDVVVRPTLAGLRAGKDEVLDRALLWLTSHR